MGLAFTDRATKGCPSPNRLVSLVGTDTGHHSVAVLHPLDSVLGCLH